ncbi:uncharacterized protein LOC107611333 [Arachis ipaensis]|uniref:uncharacterized protein LOC107611333 n=1 Tax=Arachis ipaensis TaxID=130454 RepID=UPI0007AFDA3A|nr:uncharacterized protein LOC107611333 [Arachis ipaensis]XP_025670464.1 uncharacterized protein LOC112770297 [Arachis hypogaea]
MELVDLAINDRKYTWFRGQSYSRIDRSLVSLEWLDAYPDTRLRGGSRGLSNHCPLIVEDRRIAQGPRPFRSLDAWFMHEGFLKMMKEEWRGLGDVWFLDKLKALAKPLGRWHKQYFGNIHEKIQRFEDEIKKVDDMVSNRVYDGTIEVKKKGAAKRRNNQIESLVINRRLVKNHARIKVATKDFYMNLYHQDESPNISFRDGLVNHLEMEEAQALEVLPTEEELKQAVWDYESSKALSSDGYNMNFIKRCWRIHDGALIACETVQWIKLKKKASAIIKLDFQKAYDRVK